MSNLARLVPHIIDQTDQGTRGWSRRWQLVGVVASRTWDPNTWTELGIRQLQELGRTYAEARHDRDLLQELANDGILQRLSAGGHRRADLWRIAGGSLDSLRRWRNVPWLVSREHAIDVLRAIEPGVTKDFGAILPGQSAAFGSHPAGSGRLGNPKHPAQDEIRPHQSEKCPSQSERDEPTISDADAPNGADGAPTTQCLWRSKDLSLSLSSEGGREEELNRATKAVQLALHEAGHVVWGSFFERLKAVVAEKLDDVDDLVSYASTLRPPAVKTALAALQLLDVWQPPARPAKDPTVECTVLRRRIAQAEANDPDSELLAEWRAQLAALEDGS